MALLDLSQILLPGVVRKLQLGELSTCSLVRLPARLRGVGGGMTISIYPLATGAAWLSPDEPVPNDGIVYPGSSLGPIPPETWTSLDWPSVEGMPDTFVLVAQTAHQEVYISISPARVPE